MYLGRLVYSTYLTAFSMINIHYDSFPSLNLPFLPPSLPLPTFPITRVPTPPAKKKFRSLPLKQMIHAAGSSTETPQEHVAFLTEFFKNAIYFCSSKPLGLLPPCVGSH